MVVLPYFAMQLVQKQAPNFFFNRSDANLNQVWLYLFLFTQFASFYFEFSLARWDIYFLLIGSIEMCCNGRGFNNGGGGDCGWFPVARRPGTPSVKRSSALFDAQNTGNCISLTIYIYIFLFLGGGGLWTIPPPLSEKEPYILFLNLFCYTVGSRVLKMLLKPQSNKLIFNQKKLVDKKLFLSLILILFFILGIGNPKGSSIVVRYQHDINHLRDMARNTVEGYDLWVKIILSYKFSGFFFLFQHSMTLITTCKI